MDYHRAVEALVMVTYVSVYVCSQPVMSLFMPCVVLLIFVLALMTMQRTSVASTAVRHYTILTLILMPTN